MSPWKAWRRSMPPDNQDIHGHQAGHGAVQPVPAGEPRQGQAQQDPEGSVDVGYNVLAVCLQGEGVGPLAGFEEPQAQGQIDQRGQEQEEEAELQAGDGGGMQQMGPGLPNNARGSQNNEGPLEAGGEKFHFAVAIGVALIRVTGGPEDAPQREGAGHHVDDGLQGVGEDGGGTGEMGGVKLQRHEDGAHRQGEHDGGEAHPKIGGIRQIHNGNKEFLGEGARGSHRLESLCH